MKGALALWRWAGVGLVWDAADPEPAPLTAVATVAPQVNLTVIRVEAGAYLNVGGLVYGPRTLAVPQQREAIATSTEGRQLVSDTNGGATNVTDDKWAETHGNGGK